MINLKDTETLVSMRSATSYYNSII